MNSLSWKSPPQKRQSSTNWAEVATELRSKPGEWALVAVKDTAKRAATLTSSLRWGRWAAGERQATPLGDGQWEVERRGVSVYVRFIAAEVSQ